MFCDTCGKQIPDDAQFCEFCGTRILIQPNYPGQGTGQLTNKGLGQGTGQPSNNNQNYNNADEGQSIAKGSQHIVAPLPARHIRENSSACKR